MNNDTNPDTCKYTSKRGPCNKKPISDNIYCKLHKFRSKESYNKTLSKIEDNNKNDDNISVFSIQTVSEAICTEMGIPEEDKIRKYVINIIHQYMEEYNDTVKNHNPRHRYEDRYEDRYRYRDEKKQSGGFMDILMVSASTMLIPVIKILFDKYIHNQNAAHNNGELAENISDEGEKDRNGSHEGQERNEGDNKPTECSSRQNTSTAIAKIHETQSQSNI